LLLLVIVALLPFTVTDVVEDVLDQSAPVAEILPPSPAGPEVRSSLHLEVTALNEWEGTVSIRVAAHQSCGRTCPWGDRFLILSAYGDSTDPHPVTDIVTLPATQHDVTQVVKLPVFGDPIRYPFDKYRLGLGVIVERIFPDGSTRTLTPEE